MIKTLSIFAIGLAVVMSATALVFSITHAGPRGAVGPSGAQGPAGEAADTAVLQGQVADLEGQATKLASFSKRTGECLTELGAYLNGYHVTTNSDSSGNAYWLTSAYLENGQQVTRDCQKFLGLAVNSND